MYRISRNIEASLVDFITTELSADGWKDIRVEKSFAEVYIKTKKLPCILVNVAESEPTKKEIGSPTFLKYIIVNVRIFADSDGIRLDLKDWFVDKLQEDINYYTYTITSGSVIEKILSGKIMVREILREEKELVNTENLELIDKYRHLINFRCYVAKQEDC